MVLDPVIPIRVEQVEPEEDGFFRFQGIPSGTVPSERLRRLYQTVLPIFYDRAQPVGIAKEISIDAFSELYRGEGLNEPETPLALIYPRARSLALAAFTLGKPISDEIESLYQKDMALAYMLDSMASFSTDKAARVIQTRFHHHLVSDRPMGERFRVLWYSPGYCGWHISGQQKLFGYLNPHSIGITLTERFLMVPLKSISGVLVAGEPGIHRFPNRFPFCIPCKTRNCRERIEPGC